MTSYDQYPFGGLKRKSIFCLICLLSTIFNFHGLLVAYNSSTYMEKFVDNPALVGVFYIIGSIIAIFIFLYASTILRMIGNVALVVIIAVIEIAALILIGLAPSPIITVLAFIVFVSLNPVAYISLDIFSESLIGNKEQETGSKRGLILTLMSFSAIMAPLVLAFIVGHDGQNLYKTYLISAGAFSVFLILILLFFRKFKDPVYNRIQVFSAIKKSWHDKDIRNGLLSHLTLQIFFAWMVIYLPLYLATEINMPWDEIGIIISAGLFAYVIFEYPIGVLADKYLGEKEMMALGFFILIISSASLIYFAEASLIGWMIIMFISRAGAALVEATTESYFFKHIKSTDVNIISFFRTTRPLAILIGALGGSVALLFLPFNMIFIVAAVFMIPGLYFTYNLKDSL